MDHLRPEGNPNSPNRSCATKSNLAVPPVRTWRWKGTSILTGLGRLRPNAYISGPLFRPQLCWLCQIDWSVSPAQNRSRITWKKSSSKERNEKNMENNFFLKKKTKLLLSWDKWLKCFLKSTTYYDLVTKVLILVMLLLNLQFSCNLTLVVKKKTVKFLMRSTI